MATAEDLAQAAVEALLEDETLRGDLTDSGFGPVLDWATQVAMAGADHWLAQPDPRAAMWDSIGALKNILRGVVGAAESVAQEPLVEVSGPLRRDVVAALDGVDWSGDPDADAPAIVAAIAPLPWADTLFGGEAVPSHEGAPKPCKGVH